MQTLEITKTISIMPYIVNKQTKGIIKVITNKVIIKPTLATFYYSLITTKIIILINRKIKTEINTIHKNN